MNSCEECNTDACNFDNVQIPSAVPLPAPTLIPLPAPTQWNATTPVPTPAPALPRLWELGAIAVTIANLLLSIVAVRYIRYTLAKYDPEVLGSNMTLFAMVLGWIDMVSDVLFAIEVRLERTRLPELTNC